MDPRPAVIGAAPLVPADSSAELLSPPGPTVLPGGRAVTAPPAASAFRPAAAGTVCGLRSAAPTPAAASGFRPGPPIVANGWKQRQPRAPHRLPCRVRLVDARTGEIRTVSGQTVNLSPGGVALEVSLDVPVGTWVETLVPRADGTPLFLCGTVVNIRRTLAAGYEIGVALAREDG